MTITKISLVSLRPLYPGLPRRVRYRRRFGAANVGSGDGFDLLPVDGDQLHVSPRCGSKFMSKRFATLRGDGDFSSPCGSKRNTQVSTPYSWWYTAM